MKKGSTPAPIGISSGYNQLVRGFTLLELIVVLVIVGVLATLGITQYAEVVERARVAEAKVRIGYMRQLAMAYYWKNGSLAGLQDADLDVDYTCSPSSFYKYQMGGEWGDHVRLNAFRCTSGGKAPNATRPYHMYMDYYPATGAGYWVCYYQDNSAACFGMPPA